MADTRHNLWVQKQLVKQLQQELQLLILLHKEKQLHSDNTDNHLHRHHKQEEQQQIDTTSSLDLQQTIPDMQQPSQTDNRTTTTNEPHPSNIDSTLHRQHRKQEQQTTDFTDMPSIDFLDNSELQLRQLRTTTSQRSNRRTTSRRRKIQRHSSTATTGLDQISIQISPPSKRKRRHQPQESSRTKHRRQDPRSIMP